MKSKLLPIPAGTLFTITTGAYSDYIVQGVFRAVKEIDTAAFEAEFNQKFPKKFPLSRYSSVEDSPESFIGWAAASGAIEPFASWEWSIGFSCAPADEPESGNR